MKQLEETHQKAFINWLRLNNIVYFSTINETPWKKYVPKNIYNQIMSQFVAMGFIKGVNDTHIYLKDRILHIEFKSKKGKQSEAQINWENSVTQFDYCEYHLCYSYQEAINIVEERI